ncbi:hypothetical protein ACFOGJ_18620 [Marinibaculum pumilum]|uniref:Glycine zipper domain-containing protein n=1 Tax=Marinibaculum pumilum TaxID=1766165 RepID=A0ABV7L3R5_9PROT
MKKIAVIAFCVLTAGSVAACGNSSGERALSGGGIGAGTGALGAAVLGASPVHGAILGGAVGAATGALTDKDDIDLDFD